MTKYLVRFICLLMLCMLFISPDVIAQCPMCKMAAESNLENGGSAGAGLNKGILFMLLVPYMIIACLGFVWYKNRNKPEDEAMSEVRELLNEA